MTTNQTNFFNHEPKGMFIPTEKMASFRKAFQQEMKRQEDITIHSSMSGMFLSAEETNAFQKAFQEVFKKEERND